MTFHHGFCVICRHYACVALSAGRVLETPFGVLQPPLGSLRLKLVELLSAMLRLGNSAAESSIVEAHAAQKALSLLLRFPFNNLLHTQVTSMVLHALDSGTPTLVEHLFEGCNLLGWISEAPHQVQPTPRDGDKHAAQRKAIRAGYLGHLVLLGNRYCPLTAQSASLPSTDSVINQMICVSDCQAVVCLRKPGCSMV